MCLYVRAVCLCIVLYYFNAGGVLLHKSRTFRVLNPVDCTLRAVWRTAIRKYFTQNLRDAGNLLLARRATVAGHQGLQSGRRYTYLCVAILDSGRTARNLCTQCSRCFLRRTVTSMFSVHVQMRRDRWENPLPIHMKASTSLQYLFQILRKVKAFHDSVVSL